MIRGFLPRPPQGDPFLREERATQVLVLRQLRVSTSRPVARSAEEQPPLALQVSRPHSAVVGE